MADPLLPESVFLGGSRSGKVSGNQPEVARMFAAIMAGGSGTRFWPASTTQRPKQFLKLFGDRTMLEHTIDRLSGLATDAGIAIVCGEHQAAIARGIVGGRDITVVAEPIGRNTAACIGLAALRFRRLDPGEPIAVLPADHFIADVDGFRRVLAAGGSLARSGGIVTIGVVPTAPETGFGYIEAGDEGGEVDGVAFRAVHRFVEKPGREIALEYLASGVHYWNAGIFVFTASTILAEIAACMPELARGLERIDAALGTDDERETIAEVYGGLASVSIDYGVMEKTAANVFVIPASVGWSDLGSWPALAGLRADEADDRGNIMPEGSVAIDADACFVSSEGERPIALLGVRDLIVVDAPDGLLVAAKDRAQDVRLVTERLNRKPER